MADYKIPTPTQKPVPSADIRDVVFAGAKVDEWATSPEYAYTDRFGKQHLTAEGINNQFQQFLLNSGYEYLADYIDGPITFTRRNQITAYSGEFYRPKASVTLPYTTTGNTTTTWATDESNFVAVGDADLRNQLAKSTGASLIGGLSFVTPEMAGAAGDGVTDDTAILQKLISVEGANVLLVNSYATTSKLVPAAGVRIFGPGKIINTSSVTFTWSASNRASSDPAIMVKNADVTIEEITIQSTYEAVQGQSGADNTSLRFVKGGGTESARSSSSAFVFFNCNNISLYYCEGAYTGSEATWDDTTSDIKSGGCDGLDFGAINRISVVGCYFHDVGRNGINWYGASLVAITGCVEQYCGQSGIQPGPHPNYSGVIISDNTAEYCCADSIDCRYTGSSSVAANMLISNCRSDWIGMLYGDTNYVSNDGTGVVTLALVTHVVVTGCLSKNASGVILWLQSCQYINLCNIEGLSAYTRYGIGFYTSCSNIVISDVNVIVKGPALWFGGSSTFSDFKVSDCRFESTDSYSVLMPNNTLTRFKFRNNDLVGYKIVNVIFDMPGCDVTYMGTTDSALYIASAYLIFTGLTVSGSTSSPLVLLGVATGVVIDDSKLVNAGSGPVISVPSAVGFMLSKSRIWNTGTGDAIALTGSQNGSVLSNADLYSKAGKWMNSSASSHIKLITDNNRENGAVASTWASITNVFSVSVIQRS